MATCKKCGEFFQPTTDEERLMAQHKMDEVCMDCAMLAEDLTDDGWKPPPLRVPQEKTDGTKLFRAERFGPSGKLLCFLALPPKPLRPAHISLRKPRPHNVHVTFFSEQNQRLTTEPRVIVHTNLESFRKTGHPFWVKKIPDFWDPHSGVGHIQVPHDSVIDVVDGEGERKVLLRDGGYIRLLYK